MVCPRCHGQGTIRDTESLALSILRLIEEESSKDRTSQIRAILPVTVATYLLNEKRHEVHNAELRHQVRVVIVPNPNMETPHYEVVRPAVMIIQLPPPMMRATPCSQRSR